MSDCSLRSRSGGILAILLLALAGCSSPEDRAAEHLADARAHLEAKDYVKAKLEVRNALQVQPKNADANYLLATLLEREEDVRGTLAQLQLAIDNDKAHVEARTKLGLYYVAGRAQKEAREQADEVLRLAPDRADSHYLAAKVLLLEEKLPEAIAAAEQARALDPQGGEIVGYAALLHARAGDLPKAFAVIDEGIKATDAARGEYLRNARISIMGEAGNTDGVQAEVERMVKDYPDRPMYRMALADIYLAKGRSGDAAALIEQLIASDPDNAEWRVKLAELLANANRVEDAEQALKKAIADQPDSALLKLSLASFYETRNRRDDALATYAEVAGSGGEAPDRLAAKNRIAALNIGVDDKAARRIIDEILAETPDNSDALMVRGAYRVDERKFQEAIADLRGVLARQPESTRALLMLARTHVLAGEAALAEDYYRRLLKLEPGNPVALRELGVLANSRGNSAEAESLLTNAITANPGDADASRSLVAALLRQKDFEAAAAEAARIAGSGDESGIAEYQLGIALAAQQRNDEAIEAFQDSLAKNPGAKPPLEALVALYAAQGRNKEAETLLRNVVAKTPGNERARLLLGELLGTTGRVGEARALFKAMLKENPRTPGAWIGLAGLEPADSDGWIRAMADGHKAIPEAPDMALALGNAYQRRKNVDAAIRVYEQTLAALDNDFVASNLAALLLDFRKDAASHTKALELTERFAENGHPLSKAILGWAYYRNGDYAAAVRQLETAVAANPEQAQVRYYLGMAYLENDNPTGARQELQKAVALGGAAAEPFVGLDAARSTLAGLAAR
jgi:tetratricopeptide (TPR) repeat protein